MIRFDGVSFSYPNKSVLQNLSFSIVKGKTYALVGESGSGKTTTLRLMNGLLVPGHGSVFIDNQKFNFKEGEKWRRKMGYSIQGSGLFPHMSIAKNMNLIARKENWPKEKIDGRIEELCNLVNLPFDQSFLSKLPREISGGQRQRVGIARALFMSPEILLMDEPFGALDPITREEIQNEFIDLQEKLQITIVLVTHDLSEAFRMADEVILLHQGRIAQKSKPAEFLLHPADEYVARFMQTHSPSHLLKSVKLYSVISGNILTVRKMHQGFEITDLHNETSQQISDLSTVIEMHATRNQQFVYWVDENGFLKEFQNLEHGNLTDTFTDKLFSRDDILLGMKKIMSSELPLFPVVGSNGKMLGVFSKGALDAL